MTTKLTYKYRIKDANSRKTLALWAKQVNFVWNYCKDVSRKSWRRHRRCLSGFDLNNLTSGSSKELQLPSQTIQATGEQLARSAKQHHKIPKWRSARRSLGWVPFKAKQIKIENDTITFNKTTLRFWKSRPLGGPIKTGSFTQDIRGRWYINLVCEVPTEPANNTKAIGIDLGLKDQLTLSDGTKYKHESITKQYEYLLAKAQRAHNQKQIQKIHTKIKNIRKDWIHKTTTKIARSYGTVVVGNIKTKQLQRKGRRGLNKSLADASWFSLKTTLKYKVIRLGGKYKEINEAYTTQTCSCCNQRTGPRGLKGLKEREWICSHCGSFHDRDQNAAKNILRLGHQSLLVASLPVGIPVL